MSNSRKLKFSADRVQKLTQGYEERIQRQIEIINRLKARAEHAERAARGAEIIAAGLLRQIGGEAVLTRVELEEIDTSKVVVTEREDNGMVIRMEA